ncbi:hypothetical protein IMCC9480_1577 [Oxalobacteraceae bacterium IMCC9480]|nr:hypothetical protein IMCC9480_1577 [Oxalobacteraceae bacterium IMCC9480]
MQVAFVLLADADGAGALSCHVELDAVGIDTVIGRVAAAQRVVDKAAAAFDFAGHDGGSDVAADVDGVIAQPADEGCDHAGGGAQHKEMVIAFESVDFEFFGIAEVDIEACALHAVFGDDKVIRQFGTKHDDRIDAAAAVDADRGVDVVFDMVVAAAAADQGVGYRQAAGTVLDRKGAHDELVIAVFAKQFQWCLVAVDREAVVAIATEHSSGKTDAARQETKRGFYGADFIAGGDLRRDAVLAEHLAELEPIGTAAAIERGQRGIVIDVERIVAVESVDQQAAIDRVVVVDPFDQRAAGMQQCDKIGAQQEQVGLRGAIDGQLIGTVVGRAAVVDVDDEVGIAIDIDREQVGAAVAVEPDLVAHAAMHRAERAQMTDRDAVFAGTTADEGIGRQCQLIGGIEARRAAVRIERNHVVAVIAGDREGGGADRAPDMDRVIAGRAGDADQRRAQRALQGDDVGLRFAEDGDALRRDHVAADGDAAAGSVDVGLAGGIAIAVALVVAGQRDVALRLHQRTGFDQQVVAGQQAHRRTGAANGHAGSDDQVVRFSIVLVMCDQHDLAAGNHVAADRQRTHRSNPD